MLIMSRDVIDFENMEQLSDDMLSDYNKIIEADIPSLWDKIEQGYKQEFASMNSEQSNQNNIPDNVIDIKKIQKRKISAVIGAAAAIILVMLVSAPLMLGSLVKRSMKSDDVVLNMTDNYAANDFAAESADMFESYEAAEEEYPYYAEEDIEVQEENEYYEAKDSDVADDNPIYETTESEIKVTTGAGFEKNAVVDIFEVGYKIQMSKQ